ncbi:substrate-binding domain-containing protein [Hymenobacter psychrotolerans]|uniref:histidine kinase n=1 Tax=Hymenobacter psychrotolerans DSM 18569 TaxID=1121959 RepID=A0A1M6R6D2_9BACT|nr:substrate-binding domain-containing protein [Hymenobacter psychrotolerans]SHK27887.1 ABC-type sugar transport system, substrate-binding protein, contains N-terminal xre family HTH domain [Hymenobacter psychrotolerans DSM 18569]
MPHFGPRFSFLVRCAFFLGLLLGIGSCAQPAAKPRYTIGFSQCTNGDAWRQAMLAGMKKELSFYPEVDFHMKDAKYSSTLQQEQIKEFLEEGIDLLIVSANEAEPVTPIIEEVYNRGIPVVILDRRTTSKLYTAYVGGNNEEVGHTAGNYVANLLKQKGRVVEVLGAPGSSPAVDRHLGFEQALAAYPGIQKVAQINSNWERPSVLERLPAVLRAQPNVDLIFAHNDRLALGAYQVCKQLGMQRRVKIVGVDGLPGSRGGIQLVQDGILTATLLYSPGGEEAIRTAMRILSKQPYDKENILSTMVIDSTNVLTMKMQTEKLASQQQDIQRQQQLLLQQRATYASQQTVLYVLAAALLGAAVLGLLAFRAFRVNRRINQTLGQQNEEIRSQRNQIQEFAERAKVETEAKLRFFTNFSHELRTPLTLILGPVEEMLTASPTDLPAAHRHDLSLIRRNAQRLLQLVNQLMDFRKIDVGKMPVRATEGNLVGFVREIMDVFEKPARQRGISLRFLPSEPAIRLWFDVNILDKVFFNLLSNALKFTPDRGQITVSLQLVPAENSVRLSVEDTGRGISEQDRAHIFEWFYQGQQSAARGSGMGLALALGLTRLHLGQLTFTSQPGKGSTFVVTLPLELPPALKLPTDSAAPQAMPALALEEGIAAPATTGELPAMAGSEALVLVIEDNPDVNAFLTQKLQPHFQVSSAFDGATGLRLAAESIPDLIVCDVMLPELSGLEVVAQLKGDWRTSHIPVVLLTARNAPEQQVEGVQAGADLYLTKPFNPTFLLESLRTLLANRDKMREHFRRELSVDTVTVAPQRVDQKFLADLTAIVEANLGRSDLTVEDVARSLGISRVQLYRKVKAVLGTGVTDFIQGIRLTKARQLLLDDEQTIAEVAYQLGFSSPSYFSTSFKARYQVSPSEFRALHTTPSA